jgi:hypothetical protein
VWGVFDASTEQLVDLVDDRCDRGVRPGHECRIRS